MVMQVRRGLFGQRNNPGVIEEPAMGAMSGIIGEPAPAAQVAKPAGLSRFSEPLLLIGSALRDNSDGSQIVDYLAQKRAMQMAPLQAQAQRQAKFDDWRQQYDYEMSHPKPVNNDTINDFDWYKGLSTQDKQVYHQMHPQYRQGPDGQFYPIQVAPAAPSGPLPVFTADDLNKAGGGAGNGTSGFHRRSAR